MECFYFRYQQILQRPGCTQKITHTKQVYMLRYCFIILSFAAPLSLFAQAPQLGTTIEDEFKVSAVPDKWKSESAVIIGQKTEYLFSRLSLNKNSAVCRIQEYVHKRIKLQDKNSLEKFSTFYYVTMGKDGIASYK